MQIPVGVGLGLEPAHGVLRPDGGGGLWGPRGDGLVGPLVAAVIGELGDLAGGSGDGAEPRDSLTLAGSTLYGMTYYGGADDYGTVFSLVVIPEPSSLVMAVVGLAVLVTSRRSRWVR